MMYSSTDQAELNDKSGQSRIAITGSSGQLGAELCRLLGPRALPLDSQGMDLTQPAEIVATVRALRPDVLINAAAYTAVDAAQTDAQRCFAVNHEAVRTLADVTAETDCVLVQLSTDYVFGRVGNRTTPLAEDDPIDPIGIYAQSKALGEQAACQHPNHLIIRTCGIYGPPTDPSRGNSGGNFVHTMLRLGKANRQVKVVADQVCSPTWVAELAAAIGHLVETRQRGLFHVVNPGAVSWFEFTQHIFRIMRLACTAVPIRSEEYGAAAPRPHFSALGIEKYRRTSGPPMSPCLQALETYLGSLGQSTSHSPSDTFPTCGRNGPD